jgi:hypothetical protein
MQRGNGDDDDNNNNKSLGLLSDYEIRRARNIERNNARLVHLGLLSIHEEQVSNASAWKTTIIQRNANPDESIIATNENETLHDKKLSLSKKNKKRPLHETSTSGISKSNDEIQVGSRKSLRLQGITVSSSYNDDENNDNYDSNRIQLRREQRRRECHEVRQRIALEYATTNMKNTNPTATYEHCLYRIRTMSHKALENRIRIIERAAGKHSIIKMAITASCLKDAEIWDLADLASSALERLKALAPPLSPSST